MSRHCVRVHRETDRGDLFPGRHCDLSRNIFSGSETHFPDSVKRHSSLPLRMVVSPLSHGWRQSKMAAGARHPPLFINHHYPNLLGCRRHSQVICVFLLPYNCSRFQGSFLTIVYSWLDSGQVLDGAEVPGGGARGKLPNATQSPPQ